AILKHKKMPRRNGANLSLITMSKVHESARSRNNYRAIRSLWAEWEELLKDKIGIGKSHASELMQIADGTKTVEGVAADRRERQRKAAAITKAKLSVDDGENSVAAAGALVPAEKEASAEKDGDHLGFFRDGEPISWEEATLGPEGAAA